MRILTPNIKLFHSVLSLYVTSQINQSLGTSKLDVKNFHSVKNPLVFRISFNPACLVHMFFNWTWAHMGKHERIQPQKDFVANVPIRKFTICN